MVVSEYVPGSHAMQAALDVAPTAEEYVPTAQNVQLVLPTASAYEFSGHAVHLFEAAPTTSEYFPTPQSVHAVLPAIEYFPAGHEMQDAEDGGDTWWSDEQVLLIALIMMRLAQALALYWFPCVPNAVSPSKQQDHTRDSPFCE